MDMMGRKTLQRHINMWLNSSRTIFSHAWRLLTNFISSIVRNAKVFYHSAIMLGILFLAILLFYETFRDSGIVIESILIPQELHSRGYTPDVVARRLRDSSNMYLVRSILPPEYATFGIPPKNVDVEFSASGVSLKSLANYFRDLLGRNDSTVTGEMLYHYAENKVSVRLRLDADVIFDSSTHDSDSEIEEMFGKAGYELTKRINPYILATYHYSRNEKSEASNIASYILRNFTSSTLRVGALNIQGMILGSFARFDEADQYYRSAVKIQPHSSITYTNWCILRMQMGDFEGAVDLCLHAVQLDPNVSAGHTNLSAAYLGLGSPNFNAAIEYSKNAIRLDSNRVSARINWGVALMALGKTEEAIEHFSQVLAIDPYNFNATLNRGSALAELEKPNWESAIQHFEMAVELDPNSADAFKNWGYALKRKESPDWDLAKEKYRKAISIDPNDASTYSSLGLTLMNQLVPDWNEASKQFRKVIEIDPNNAAAYFNLGTCLINLEAPDWESAIDHFMNAVKIEPDYSLAYLNWGFALANKGDPDLDGAIEQYNSALKFDPDNTLIYQNLGSAFVDKGDCLNAKIMFDAASQIDGLHREYTCPLTN